MINKLDDLAVPPLIQRNLHVSIKLGHVCYRLLQVKHHGSINDCTHDQYNDQQLWIIHNWVINDRRKHTHCHVKCSKAYVMPTKLKQYRGSSNILGISGGSQLALLDGWYPGPPTTTTAIHAPPCLRKTPSAARAWAGAFPNDLGALSWTTRWRPLLGPTSLQGVVNNGCVSQVDDWKQTWIFCFFTFLKKKTGSKLGYMVTWVLGNIYLGQLIRMQYDAMVNSQSGRISGSSDL